MIPQPPEFFDLFSTDHRRLEAAAAAERLRGPGRSPHADRLDSAGDRRPALRPPSAPPRTASVPAPRSLRPARSRCHPVVVDPYDLCVAATGDRRTESGIEVKPVYTAADAPRELEPPGEYPVHPRAVPGHVPRPAVDDPPVRRLRLGGGVERALPLPPRARPDRPLDRVRPADAARLRLRRSACARRGRPHGRRDRLDRRHGDPARRDPARRGLDVDDDQRARVAPAPALRARRRGAGRGAGRAPRHRPERHPQGVHRARELHLPAAALDAADDRPVRVLRRADPALEHDLDQRLPHPRGGLDGGAGARVHARERHRLLRGGGRGRAVARRLRRAPLLLLQRAQRLLPGGGEVPRGAAAVGADHARALRRDEPAGARAPLPRADRRLDADGAAAGEQHRPRRDPGAVGRVPAARSSLHTNCYDEALALPTEHAARIALRTQQILAAEARHDRHGRPARRLLLHRGADRRARGARLGADRARRRGRRRRRGGRVAASCRRRSSGRVRVPAAGRGGRARHRRRQRASRRTSGERIELLRIDPAAERRQLERTARVRAERNAEEAAAALAAVREAARGEANLLPPMREALRARCTVGEICETLREEWGMYDAVRR